MNEEGARERATGVYRLGYDEGFREGRRRERERLRRSLEEVLDAVCDRAPGDMKGSHAYRYILDRILEVKGE